MSQNDTGRLGFFLGGALVGVAFAAGTLLTTSIAFSQLQVCLCILVSSWIFDIENLAAITDYDCHSRTCAVEFLQDVYSPAISHVRDGVTVTKVGSQILEQLQMKTLC